MEEFPTKKIHKNAVRAWTLTACIYGLLWFLPLGIYITLSINQSFDHSISWVKLVDWFLLSIIITGTLILYFITIFLIPKMRWKRWRYDVTENEIDMLRGIIIMKRTLIPVNRIQHVDTRQGPIYRRFGLSTVTISTAATTHEIPALDDETADELRNKISALVRKVKEDV